MVAVALVWAAALGLAFVYGFSVQRVMQSKKNDGNGAEPSFFVVALIGLAVLSALAVLLSLFINLGGKALALVCAGGLALALRLMQSARQRREMGAYLREKAQAARRLHPLTLLTMAAALLIFGVKAVGEPLVYDTGLYYAQTIRWAETYPAVPGLGNLHDRLAFNSSWLALSALFSFSFVGLGSFHALNGLLLVSLLAWCLVKFDPVLRHSSGEYRLSSVTAIFIPFLLRWLYSTILTSPGNDMAAALLVWAALLLALDAVDPEPQVDRTGMEAAVLVLACFAVTVKLSALPVLFAPAYLALRRFTRLPGDPRQRVRLLGVLAVIVLAFFLPWMARSAIQSGYLVYPLPQVDVFSFDWKIPVEKAHDTQSIIRTWARAPGVRVAELQKMSFIQWLGFWWGNQTYFAKAVMLACGLALGLLAAVSALFVLRKQRWPGEPGGYRVLLGTAVVGVVYWFWQAPVMRFGYVFLGALLALAAGGLLWAWFRFAPRLSRLSATLLVLAFLAYQVLDAARMNWAAAANGLWLPGTYAEVETVPQPVGPATIFTPVNGDQCWYDAFPCTNAIHPGLALRGETLREGFWVPEK